jgi:hypothetical protein
MPLSPWWRAGALLHRIGRDAQTRAVSSWDEAITWASSFERVDELQFWGHGGWGFMDLGRARGSIAKRWRHETIGTVFAMSSLRARSSGFAVAARSARARVVRSLRRSRSVCAAGSRGTRT